MTFITTRRKSQQVPMPTVQSSTINATAEKPASRLRKGGSRLLRILSTKSSVPHNQVISTVLPEPVLPQFSTASEFPDMLPVDFENDTLVNDSTLQSRELSLGSPLDGLTETLTNAPPPLPPRPMPSVLSFKTSNPGEAMTLTRRASPENRPTYSLFPKDLPQDMRRIQSSPQVPLSSSKSMIFNVSTVVRRPPQGRPNLGRLDIPLQQHQHELQSISASSSDTSGLEDSIFTINSPSTADTSMSPVSDIASRYRSRISSPRTVVQPPDKAISSNNLPQASPLRNWKDLVRNDAASLDLSVIRKTKGPRERVAMAEKVAATKIFFETYYDDTKFEELMCCGTEMKKATSPRSLRRLKAEQALQINAIPADQRRAWLKHFSGEETCHLRHIRLLKARRAIEGESISTAGYETVRVLGKGSFGTVSLVRDYHNHGTKALALFRQRRRPVYAMKVIKKVEMLRSCQEAHLRAERDFLVKCIAANSRWVVPLVASFQDPNNLYLVMDFQIGGDFLNLLQITNRGVLHEEIAKFYLAEMVLCIEETHKYRWIHRDVKPDNFLITSSGHLKISDFGLAFDGHWAHTQTYYNEHRTSLLDKLGIRVCGDKQDREETLKQLKRSRSLPAVNGGPGTVLTLNSSSMRRSPRLHHRKLARSIVGTSQYMAPEVVHGDLYDGRCDWWSIGIILYECLYGFTPFCREDRDATKRAILNFDKEFEYPEQGQCTTPAAQDLIQRLLSHRQMRLSAEFYATNDYKFDASGKAIVCISNHEKLARDYAGRPVHPNDAAAIKRHPFFQDIDWDTLHRQKAPFVPKVRHEESTKYFEPEEQILNDVSSVAESIKPDAELDAEAWRKLQVKMQQKRPRDKVLRDPEFADVVLKQRMESAFWGYTWKRPSTWALGEQLKGMFGDEVD